jgi:DNA-binding transcriptional MerR regulator
MARRAAGLEGDERGFGRQTVLKATGITYRQLDYWAREDIVVPSIADARGSGSQRRWSFTDILELKLIKKLMDTGVSLQQVRRALDYVRDRLGKSLQDVYLFSDGTSIFAGTSPDEIVDLLRGGQGVFGIAVGKVYEELQGTIAEFRKREGEEEAGPKEPPAEAHGS